MMLHQATQTSSCVRRDVRGSVAARPAVLSGPRSFKQQMVPARRLSTIVKVAEMERTAEEDALMFCYQVCFTAAADRGR
jgi:hypothetical protein